MALDRVTGEELELYTKQHLFYDRVFLRMRKCMEYLSDNELNGKIIQLFFGATQKIMNAVDGMDNQTLVDLLLSANFEQCYRIIQENTNLTEADLKWR